MLPELPDASMETRKLIAFSQNAEQIPRKTILSIMAERDCRVNAESREHFHRPNIGTLRTNFSFQKVLLPLVYATLRWTDG